MVRSITSARRAARVAVTATTAAFALVAAGGAATAAVAAPAAGGTSSGAAHRIGATPHAPAGAVRSGAPAGDTALHLSVNLAPRDREALKQYVTQLATPGSPGYHRYLAKGQFAATFGPSAATVAAVRQSLKDAGLTPGKLSADGLSLSVDTTVAQASKALSVGFADYKLADGSTGFLNTAAPQLHGSVATQVTSITGLNATLRVNAQHTAPHSVASAATSGTSSRVVSPNAATGGPALCDEGAKALGTAANDGVKWYSAPTLAASYSLDHTATSGAGSTIAFFELEKYNATDLAHYQSCYGTHVSVSNVLVDGGPKVTPDGTNIGVESLLDIENVVSLAPGAKVLVYQGPDASTATGAANPKLTDTQVLDVYRHMVTDDNANVLSTSWGSCEIYTSDALSSGEYDVFLEAASQGQTVLAASGDNGASGCAAYSGATYQWTASADDPAGQPLVTAVGGTKLSGKPASSRTTWNASGFASGGGESYWCIPSGWYQSGVAGPGFSNSCTSSGTQNRQVPDVAADGAPASGYPIYVGGKWQVVGGTSGAAPTWAALVAIADTNATCKANGPLGFLNPALYHFAGQGGFTDITGGTNNIGHGGYSAGTGYDMTTGLGEPVGDTLIPQLCGSLPTAAKGAGTYHAVSPQRLVDTRAKTADFGGARVPGGQSVGVQIEGNAGMPTSGVTAVVLNVTVTQTATANGWLTAWPDGSARPKTSNLNWFATNQTISNLVTVPVAGDGWVDLYVNNPAHVIADVQGYYTNDTTGLAYTPQAPARVLDTRAKVGVSTNTPITESAVTLKVAGVKNVPPTATAVVLNVTATQTGGGGYIAAYPAGSSRPNVSNINWSAKNTTLPGLVIVPVGSDGSVSLYVHGTAHVVADVFGYFDAGSTLKFTKAGPARLLNATTVASHGQVDLQVTGRAGVPAGAKAVVLNVTVTKTTGTGWLTAWGDGLRPGTSNLNWVKGWTVPNLVVVPIDSNGKVHLYVNSSTQVLADVFGYYN